MYVSSNATLLTAAKPYIQSPTNLVMLGQEHAMSVARKCKNKFWSQVLNAWGKLLCKVKNINTVICSPLWYNPAISKAQLYLPHWYKKEH